MHVYVYHWCHVSRRTDDRWNRNVSVWRLRLSKRNTKARWSGDLKKVSGTNGCGLPKIGPITIITWRGYSNTIVERKPDVRKFS